MRGGAEEMREQALSSGRCWLVVVLLGVVFRCRMFLVAAM